MHRRRGRMSIYKCSICDQYKDADKDGKRRVVPKDEVKEVLGRSPDSGDCLLMRMYFELKPSIKTTHFNPGLTYRR